VGDYDDVDSNLIITINTTNSALFQSISLMNCSDDKTLCEIFFSRLLNQTIGTATITVTVTDSFGKSAFITFTVSVTSFPQVSLIENLAIYSSQLTIPPVPFSVADSDHPGSQITLTVDSSRTAVIPLTDLSISCDTEKIACNLTITRTIADGLGQTVISITATDPLGGVGTGSFILTVAPDTGTSGTTGTFGTATRTIAGIGGSSTAGDGDGTKKGDIAGIVIGSVLGALLLCCIIILLVTLIVLVVVAMLKKGGKWGTERLHD